MTVQTTYTKNIRPAIAGMIAYDFGTADVTSHNVIGTIPFGVAVKRGPVGANDNDNTIKLGTATTDELSATNVVGFTVRSLLQQNAVNNNLTSYAVGETAAVMREGYIFVTNSGATAIVEGETIGVNPVTGAVEKNTTASTIVLSNCIAQQDAAAGAILLIRVDGLRG